MKLLLDPGGTRLKFARLVEGRIGATGEVSWYRLQESGLGDGTLSTTDALDGQCESGTDAAWALHVLDRPDPPAAGPNWVDRFCRAAEFSAWECRSIGVPDKPGFTVEYQGGQPGSDRMAAAVACHAEDPGGSFIIIDAGTCITVDLMSPGHWRGGAILPGLALQARSMKEAGLPEIAPLPAGGWGTNDGVEEAIGTSTEDAIRAGIPWATRKSVEAICRAFMALDPCAQVILTGGDAGHFDGVGGWQTFADPNLVLRGAARLLLMQER